MHTLTLFVSSPGDVQNERYAVGQVVEKLQARFWSFVRLELVLWERKALRATAHFQEELVRPSECDIVLGILWHRLGTPLPDQFKKEDGSSYDSGTEWELVEAFDGYERTLRENPAGARPDILVYRRMDPRPTNEDAAAERAESEQEAKSARFFENYFINPDGTNARAFSPYRGVKDFQNKLTDHLTDLILKRIPTLKQGFDPPPISGNPFLDLQQFEFRHRDRFFGRNRAIREVLDQLKRQHARGHSFLLIYGASGYGKSSLMRAGLAPRLTARGYLDGVGGWRRLLLIPSRARGSQVEQFARDLLHPSAPGEDEPGDAPSHGLPELRETGADGHDTASLSRLFSDAETLPFALADLVAALDRAGTGTALLVQIDQFEEIFTTRSISAQDRTAFFRLLSALSSTGRVWIVATMRSEFFPEIARHDDLRPLVQHGGGYILQAPDEKELSEIIRYPALAARLNFERHPTDSQRDLSDFIYESARNQPDALPLLEFTLSQLYSRLDEGTGERTLKFRDYEDLGGLEGAIATLAQQAFATLAPHQQDAHPFLFAKLVQVQSGSRGEASKRRAPLQALHESHPGAPAFIAAFKDNNLLVTDHDASTGEPTITLGHEALLKHWPLLAEWIDSHRADLQAESRLREETRRWSEHRAQAGPKTARRLLLAEARLAEAQRVEDSGLFHLDDESREFLALSRRRASLKQRALQGAIAVFAALAIVAGFLAVRSSRLAEQEARLSNEMERELYRTRISQAGESLRNGAIGDTLTSLALCPADLRGPEWELLYEATPFVPLVLAADEIDILDEGPLQGSGLRELAGQVLAGQGRSEQVSPDGTMRFHTISGGRGGGEVIFTRVGSPHSISTFPAKSYSGGGTGLFSADGTCLICDNTALRSEMLGLNSEVVAGDLVILPVPANRTALQSPDWDGEWSLDRHGFAARDGSGACLVKRPGMPPRFLIPTDDVYGQDLDTLLPALAGKTPGAEALPGNLAEFDRLEKEGVIYSLAYDFESATFSLWNLAEGKELDRYQLPDLESRQAFEANTRMADAFTTAAQFGPSGHILICPFRSSEAGVFAPLSFDSPIALGGAVAFAHNQMARPGSSTWSLSPEGDFVSAVIYDAPGAELMFEVCSATSGKSLARDSAGEISRADWTADNRLFVLKDESGGILRAYDRPGGKLVATTPAIEGWNGPLASSSSTRPLVALANTLWDFPRRRKLFSTDGPLLLSDDWKQAAIISKPQVAEFEEETAGLKHVLLLEPEQPATIAHRMKLLQGQILAARAGEPTGGTLQKRIADLTSRNTENLREVAGLELPASLLVRTRGEEQRRLEAFAKSSPTDQARILHGTTFGSPSPELDNRLLSEIGYSSDYEDPELAVATYLALSHRMMNDPEPALWRQLPDCDLKTLLALPALETGKQDEFLREAYRFQTYNYVDTYGNWDTFVLLLAAALQELRGESEFAGQHLAVIRAFAPPAHLDALETWRLEPKRLHDLFWLSRFSPDVRDALATVLRKGSPLQREADSDSLLAFARRTLDWAPGEGHQIVDLIADSDFILPAGGDGALTFHLRLARVDSAFRTVYPPVFQLQSIAHDENSEPAFASMIRLRLLGEPDSSQSLAEVLAASLSHEKVLGESAEGLSALLVSAHSAGLELAARQIFRRLLSENPALASPEELERFAICQSEADLLLRLLGQQWLDDGNAPERALGLALAGSLEEALAAARDSRLETPLPAFHLRLLLTRLCQAETFPEEEVSVLLDDCEAAFAELPAVLVAVAACRERAGDGERALATWLEALAKAPDLITRSDDVLELVRTRYRTADDSSLHPFLLARDALAFRTPPGAIADAASAHRLATLSAVSGSVENLERQRALLERAVALAPDDRTYLTALAEFESEEGKPDVAAPLYRQILAMIAPDSYEREDLVSSLLRTLTRIGANEEALALLEKEGLDCDPYYGDLFRQNSIALGKAVSESSLALRQMAHTFDNRNWQENQILGQLKAIAVAGDRKEIAEATRLLFTHGVTRLSFENGDSSGEGDEGTPVINPEPLVSWTQLLRHHGLREEAIELLLQAHLEDEKEGKARPEIILALACHCWETGRKLFAANLFVDQNYEFREMVASPDFEIPAEFTALEETIRELGASLAAEDEE